MLYAERFFPLPRPAAVAIGNFDGLHVGHRRIVDRARQMAREADLDLAIVTFEPHPRRHFGQEIAPICTPDQKRTLLEAEQPDALLWVPFASVLALTAEAFVRDLLVGQLRLRALALGHDFRFGRDRRGDECTLSELAGHHGFRLAVEAPVVVDGRIVSSSLVRELLGGGDVAAAARMLGRPYEIAGTVVRGDGRGRQLGFPTLNVQSGNAILPDGVFRSRCRLGGAAYDAVTHIGPLPTFAAATRRVEAHLLDFSAQAYGETVVIELLQKIRPVLRFDSAAALAEQIRRDIETAFPGRSG